MLTLSIKNVRMVHSNILTMIVLTVFEIVLFYLFYSRKNELSVRTGVFNTVQKLKTVMPYRPEDKDKFLYASMFLRDKSNEAKTYRKMSNHETLTRVIVYVGLLTLLSTIILINSPFLKQNTIMSILNRAAVSVVFVLLTQFLLVKFIIENIKGNFESKIIELVLEKMSDTSDIDLDSVCK